MRKATILIGALVLFALCVPAFAQTFSDVPTDHWAYQAVESLASKGYIVGYPDGTFGGKRALTRYEFAMAISRVLGQINTGGVTGNFATKEEVDALGQRVTALENAPKPGGGGNFASKSDLDSLRKLVDEFRDELATLGVDVDAMKREIADLRTRMDKVEDILAKMPKINAETNVIFRGETTRSSSDTIPVDFDGRLIDSDNRMLENVRGLYDIDLSIKGNIGGDATAVALFNAGNYLNWVRAGSAGNISVNPGGIDILLPVDTFVLSPTDAREEFTPYYLYVTTPMSWGPLGRSSVTVGKFGFQLTPYTFRMMDVDSYTTNWKTDSGDYPVLGAKADFRVGPVGVTGFAFKNDGLNLPVLAGSYGLPLFFGASQTAGARLSLNTPFAGTLGLNYLQIGTDTTNAFGVTRQAVFGGDLSLNLFRGLQLAGAWTRSQPQLNSSDKLPGFTDGDAWEASLAFPIWKFNVTGGYREVQSNFDAPGNWSKGFSFLRNLADVKGPFASLSFPVTSKLTLSALGEFYKGTDGTSLKLEPTFGTGVDFLSTDDKLHRYAAGLKYGFSSNTALDFGWEHLRQSAGTPSGLGWEGTSNWYTVGLEHGFSANSSMRVLYQFINEGHNFMGAGDGAVAITQFNVKF